MMIWINGAVVDLTKTVRVTDRGTVFPCEMSDSDCIGVELSWDAAGRLGVGNKGIEIAIDIYLNDDLDKVPVLVKFDPGEIQPRMVGE